MLQLRPTFSESWYRVVSLKPRLRGTAQISRQYYRGERWYVVRDAASNQFHRLSDAAYRFVGLLDGSRTVGEAWDLVGGQLADDAPTQPEVIQILSQLYAANLVETDIPPDATVLLRRHKKQVQRRFKSRLMNLMFPRIPLWDPDRFLCRWMPVVQVFLSKLGVLLWIGVVVAAMVVVAPQSTRLMKEAGEALNIGQHPTRFLWGFLIFWLIKFIHECGHAFACRRFGGEVHEMGIMFLVFIPTPYVDASTAWAFPNKWARMFVGAAGMIVEMFVAAICAIIWAIATPESFQSMMLCYVMIIASFTTIVFNINPLLRYDGYYMLSDYLEIPNLQMRSREYVLGLIKRHVFRIKPTQPLPPPGQRALLFGYGILSTIYRVFVGIAIILMVTWQIPVLGVLMAIGGVVTWLVMPCVNLFRYLTIEPELHRKRGRAWAFTGAVATVVALIIGVLPFSVKLYADGIVEPRYKEVLRSTSPGWVAQVAAQDGQRLRKDEVILVCENPHLDLEITQTRLVIEQINIRINQLRGLDEVNAMRREEQDLLTHEKKLADLLRRKNELTIKAPIDGYLISPQIRNLHGVWLQPGMEIATVATTDTLLVKVTIEQGDAELPFARDLALIDAEDGELHKKIGTQIRLAGRPQTVLHAASIKLLQAAQPEVAHPSLMLPGGGKIPNDPEDRTGRKPLVDQFELQAEVSNPDTFYLPGQGASVQLKLGSRPLIWQWSRWFLQLVRSSSANSKWL